MEHNLYGIHKVTELGPKISVNLSKEKLCESFESFLSKTFHGKFHSHPSHAFSKVN